MAGAIIYSDGSIRCGNCEQLLARSQTVCPGCKERITEYAKFNDLYRIDKAEKQRTEHFRRENTKLSMRKSFYTAFSIIVVAVVLLFRYVLPLFNGYEIHTENPSYGDEIISGGYSYRLSQIFFKCEKSDMNEAAIKAFFIKYDIEYDNLYYTGSGYYTADLTGYRATTQAKVESQSEEIQGYFMDFFSNCGFEVSMSL